MMDHEISSQEVPPLPPGVSYLRAILLLLQNIDSETGGFHKTIYNEGLSLDDRVGFACRFLPCVDLFSFLDGFISQIASRMDGRDISEADAPLVNRLAANRNETFEQMLPR